MSQISVLTNKAITTSRFIKMRNVEFMQNGKKRSWDYVSVRISTWFSVLSMDAVSALVFDKSELHSA